MLMPFVSKSRLDPPAPPYKFSRDGSHSSLRIYIQPCKPLALSQNPFYIIWMEEIPPFSYVPQGPALPAYVMYSQGEAENGLSRGLLLLRLLVRLGFRRSLQRKDREG